MTSLTPDQVRHIAKLARLRLSEQEVQKFSTELTNILGYVEMLQEVDTANVEATAQVTGQENSFRKDEILSDSPSREGMLSTTPLSVSDHQIVTPSAHG